MHGLKLICPKQYPSVRERQQCHLTRIKFCAGHSDGCDRVSWVGLACLVLRVVAG
jgi:hypothetical protein